MNKTILAKIECNSNLGLSLYNHLEDTLGVAEKLMDNWVPDGKIYGTCLDRTLFRKTICYLAAVHDIGKCTPYFQNQILGNDNEKYRDKIIDSGLYVPEDTGSIDKPHPHAYMGSVILKELTGENRNDIFDIVWAHHDENINDDFYKVESETDDYYRSYYGSMEAKEEWLNEWKKINEHALNASGLESVSDIPVLTIATQTQLLALLKMSDWIASSTELFPLVSLDKADKSGIRYPDRIEDGWREVNMPEIWKPAIANYTEELFNSRFGFNPNIVQEEILNIANSMKEPGICTIEASTGIGKTEAALALSEIMCKLRKSSGTVIALPTQATTNGMFERVADWAEDVSKGTDNALRLLHGAASLNEAYEKYYNYGKSNDLSIHDWFQGSKKALLADFVICTIDQILMAMVQKRHLSLRHFGLAGKTLIIDEVHAYDSFTGSYLERLMTWCGEYRIPVILLSATLPTDKREKLVKAYLKRVRKADKRKYSEEPGWNTSIGYPLVTWTDGVDIHQRQICLTEKDRLVLTPRIYAEDAVKSVIMNSLKDGGCGCVIMNTIDKAEKTYEFLKSEFPDFKVILYHSGFTTEERLAKEEIIRKRFGKQSTEGLRNHCILVGTQVLEQSLDYDADVMISELCPVDLLFQRMGRLHRHKRKRPLLCAQPQCYILENKETLYDYADKCIYGDYLLKATDSIIRDSVVIPSDIPKYVNAIYNGEITAFEEEYRQYMETLKDKQTRADYYRLGTPSMRRLTQLITTNDTTDEEHENMSVRDAIGSFEVVLLKKIDDTQSTDMRSRFIYSIDDDLTNKEGKKILSQSIKLPYKAVVNDELNQLLNDEVSKNAEKYQKWLNNPWLKNKNFLVLDDDNRLKLGKYEISYTPEIGMRII